MGVVQQLGGEVCRGYGRTGFQDIKNLVPRRTSGKGINLYGKTIEGITRAKYKRIMEKPSLGRNVSGLVVKGSLLEIIFVLYFGYENPFPFIRTLLNTVLCLNLH